MSVDLSSATSSSDPVGFSPNHNKPSISMQLHNQTLPQRPSSPNSHRSTPLHLGLPYLHSQRNSSVSSLMDAVVGSASASSSSSTTNPPTSSSANQQTKMNAPPQLRNPLSPVSPPGRWDLSASGFTTSSNGSSASPADFGFVKVGETPGDWDKISDIHEVRGPAGSGTTGGLAVTGAEGSGEGVKELQEKVEKRRSQLPQLESQLAALEAQIKAAEERLARAQGTHSPGADNAAGAAVMGGNEGHQAQA